MEFRTGFTLLEDIEHCINALEKKAGAGFLRLRPMRAKRASSPGRTCPPNDGRVLHRKGIYSAAVDQFRNAVELLPHPVAAYRYRLGLALLVSGHRAGAVRELEQALAIDLAFEGSSDARRVLEEVQKTKGEPGG